MLIVGLSLIGKHYWNIAVIKADYSIEIAIIVDVRITKTGNYYDYEYTIDSSSYHGSMFVWKLSRQVSIQKGEKYILLVSNENANKSLLISNIKIGEEEKRKNVIAKYKEYEFD